MFGRIYAMIAALTASVGTVVASATTQATAAASSATAAASSATAAASSATAAAAARTAVESIGHVIDDEVSAYAADSSFTARFGGTVRDAGNVLSAAPLLVVWECSAAPTAVAAGDEGTVMWHSTLAARGSCVVQPDTNGPDVGEWSVLLTFAAETTVKMIAFPLGGMPSATTGTAS